MKNEKNTQATISAENRQHLEFTRDFIISLREAADRAMNDENDPAKAYRLLALATRETLTVIHEIID